MLALRLGSIEFSPALIIFDKDGTLIDFNFMWASWIRELAARLERAAHLTLAPQLYAAMGYDGTGQTVIAGSPLAAHSMAELYGLTGKVVHATGLSGEATVKVLNEAWFVPDPISGARPLGDLQKVFSMLPARGVRIAIATSDDRTSTMATLRGLGIDERVDALVSADDGLPNKPAPDMLLRVCQELEIPPAESVMVGDSVADMQAARAAGIGLRVGVLSGVSSRELLAPHADWIANSVEALLAN